MRSPRPTKKQEIAGPPYKERNDGGGTAMMPAATVHSSTGMEITKKIHPVNFRYWPEDEM
jgi:hypothetical protein